MILTRTPLSLSLSAILLLSQSVLAQGGGVEIVRQHSSQPQAEGGSSVLGLDDVNGDGVGDYLIGAPQHVSTGPFANGAVFLHSGADGSLVHTFSGTSGSDFGTSIAAVGDLDGDGYPDVLVGAPLESSFSLSFNGGAYVYSGATGNLIYSFFGASSYDQFGTSVAGAGDINLDGVPDLMVGAPFTDYLQIGSGSVYFFSGSNGALIRRTDGGSYVGNFGQAVAGGGDVNRDGIPDVLVGAPREGIGEEGAVYVLDGRTGTTHYVIAGQFALEWLGKVFCFVGDVNQDGHDDFILGSEESNHPSTVGHGLARVYSGATGSLLYQLGDMPGTVDFGCSVAVTDDLDGDGVGDLIVGDSRAEVNPNHLYGAAWVFSGRDGTLLASLANNLPSRFGFAVGATSDLNGDGRGEILVGAPLVPNTGNPPHGVTYVYSFNPYLTVNTRSISVSQGGLIQLDLNFSTQQAGNFYAVLMSDQGPGSFQFGVEIPLSLTPLVVATLQGRYPQPLNVGLHGVLDPFGGASAFTGLFASSPARLVGRSIYLAAVAAPAGGLPEAASIAVRVEMIP